MSLISGISSSLGGMRSEMDRINKIANNVANANTPGYRATGVGEGNTVEGDSSELSNVDLAEQFVGLISAKTGFAANVKVLKIEEELSNSLLDIIA